MTAGLDQRSHQLVALSESALDQHPVVRQCVEQPERAGRRVEADGHPDPRVLGRKARQQQGDAPVAGRLAAQRGVSHREARDPRAALRIGDVARNAGAVALLERDHAAEQPPVELGDRDLGRDVEWRQPGNRLLPGAPRSRRADSLDNRDVECGQRGRVPLVGRPRAAGREHRHHERVDVAVEQLECRHPAVAVAPQRVAPDREHVGAGPVQRFAEGVHELGVPGQVVGAVEAEADRRALGVEWIAAVDAEIWDLVRRLEPVPVEQEGVGEKAQQLLDVVHVAVAQVLAGLRDRARWRERQRGQFGVGLGLAAEREQRDAAARALLPQQVEALRPAAAAAEDPA